MNKIKNRTIETFFELIYRKCDCVKDYVHKYEELKQVANSHEEWLKGWLWDNEKEHRQIIHITRLTVNEVFEQLEHLKREINESDAKKNNRNRSWFFKWWNRCLGKWKTSTCRKSSAK